MCVQLVSILRWRMKGKKQMLHGIEIVVIDEAITPFSFFNTIFMNPALHNEQETNQILAHEKTHAQQRHSLDVLLSELLTIVCWINPAAWLLKREIRHNLEFLADNSVLKSGFDSKNYQYHLLQLTYQTPEVNLVNKFNVSPLKKRITMMNQQKTKKAGILKYSLIVPLALALVLSSNAQTIVNSAKKALSTNKNAVSNTKSKDSVNKSAVDTKKETQELVATTSQDAKPTDQQPASVQDSKTTTQQPENENIYTVVEKMPQFPGGESELMNYISRNLRYPIEAMEKGIQGRIITRFVVNKEGKVEKAEILRGIDPNLDQAGLNVINSLPNFIPGEQNGKKVAVWYTLPIVFKLEGDSKNTVYKEHAISEIIDNTKPLYIIDGKPATEVEFKALKPENIKEVNVLKGGSATAIYGSRGANGVVVITMKK